jgi:hypothetical protein
MKLRNVCREFHHKMKGKMLSLCAEDDKWQQFRKLNSSNFIFHSLSYLNSTFFVTQHVMWIFSLHPPLAAWWQWAYRRKKFKIHKFLKSFSHYSCLPSKILIYCMNNSHPAMLPIWKLFHRMFSLRLKSFGCCRHSKSNFQAINFN